MKFLNTCLLSTLFIVMLNQNLFALGDIRGGGLMVAPTRLVFEARKRTAELTLTNSGNETSTYRIKTINSTMNEFGERKSIPDRSAGDIKFADEFVKFAPRQITLKPGEQQTVRVMIRTPKSLADGEYRTGLNFQWIPDPGEPDIRHGQVNQDEVDVRIRFSYGVTIPVILKKGDLQATGKIGETAIKTSDEKRYLEAKVTREGSCSLYGDFSVFQISQEGKEILIKTIGGVAIYIPNPHRIFKVELPPDAIIDKDKKCKLRIEYRERKDIGGKLIAEKIIPFE